MRGIDDGLGYFMVQACRSYAEARMETCRESDSVEIDREPPGDLRFDDAWRAEVLEEVGLHFAKPLEAEAAIEYWKSRRR